MSAASLADRRGAAIARGVSVTTDVYADRAENAEIWDADGRRFIDFAAGIAVVNVGHRHPKVVAAMSDLLGPNVELHHSTMHVKPPSTGHPFPMHQDNPFYEHANGEYADILVHLDDTSHANGEIRFLDGSHKLGALKHVTQTEQGPCTPHLPFEQYSLESTVPVPAKKGDLVVFSIHTIHGSHINSTDQARRLVRVGYRNPLNKQVAGQSFGRPGLIVAGYRERQDGQMPFSTEA